MLFACEWARDVARTIYVWHSVNCSASLRYWWHYSNNKCYRPLIIFGLHFKPNPKRKFCSEYSWGDDLSRQFNRHRNKLAGSMARIFYPRLYLVILDGTGRGPARNLARLQTELNLARVTPKSLISVSICKMTDNKLDCSSITSTALFGVHNPSKILTRQYLTQIPFWILVRSNFNMVVRETARDNQRWPILKICISPKFQLHSRTWAPRLVCRS